MRGSHETTYLKADGGDCLVLAAFGLKTARPIVTLLTHRHHRLAGRLAQRLQPNSTSSLEGVADAPLLTGLYGR